MSKTSKPVYFKLTFHREALLFLNRIELSQKNVLQFLQSNLPHAEKQFKSSVLYAADEMTFSFRFLNRKGKFVKLHAPQHCAPYWDGNKCKGFAFQAVMYEKQQKIGRYVVFYEPYSLSCYVIAQKSARCRTLVKYFHFGAKPVVKYVFNFNNERIKRYFRVEHRGIRAYGERHLASMPDNDP